MVPIRTVTVNKTFYVIYWNNHYSKFAFFFRKNGCFINFFAFINNNHLYTNFIQTHSLVNFSLFIIIITCISMLSRQLHTPFKQTHSLINFLPFINNNHLHINVIYTIAYNLQKNSFIGHIFPIH